jgi:hypothetical protein
MHDVDGVTLDSATQVPFRSLLATLRSLRRSRQFDLLMLGFAAIGMMLKLRKVAGVIWPDALAGTCSRWNGEWW